MNVGTSTKEALLAALNKKKGKGRQGIEDLFQEDEEAEEVM